MEPVVAKFRTHREAEEATVEYYRRLSPAARLKILFRLRTLLQKEDDHLPEDWRAFIESLNSSEVEYLVVGAVALAYHGFPRYTGDLDLLVRNTPENAQRLETVLASFGFESLGLKAADLGRQALIRNKKCTGRSQDYADLEVLGASG
jgi:hypothetical protein